MRFTIDVVFVDRERFVAVPRLSPGGQRIRDSRPGTPEGSIDRYDIGLREYSILRLLDPYYLSRRNNAP
jgi:hypothetical protein